MFYNYLNINFKKSLTVIFYIIVFFIFAKPAIAGVCDGGLQCAAGNKTSCEAINGCSWVTNEAITDENPLSYSMCRALDIATGPLAQAAAAFIIIALGIGFFKGSISMAVVAWTAAGIATTFGAITIVATISGADVYECIIEDGVTCAVDPSRIPSNASAINNATTIQNNRILQLRCDVGYFGTLYGIACFDGIAYGGAGFCEESDCTDPNDPSNIDIVGAIWDDNNGSYFADGFETSTIGTLYGYFGSARAKCQDAQYNILSNSIFELPRCTFGDSTQGYQDISGHGNWDNSDNETQDTSNLIPDNEVPVGFQVQAICNTNDGKVPSNMVCEYQNSNNKTGAKWSGGDDANCSPPTPCPYSNITIVNFPLSSDPNDIYGSWNVSGGTANENDTITASCLYADASSSPQLSCTFEGTWQYSTNNNLCPAPQGCDFAAAQDLNSGQYWMELLDDGSYVEAIYGNTDILEHGTILKASCEGITRDDLQDVPQLSCNNNIWQFQGNTEECADPIIAQAREETLIFQEQMNNQVQPYLWVETTLEESFSASETIDSSSISIWNNVVSGSSFSQSNSSKKPLYISDGINGLPVIRFDGSDQINTTRNNSVNTNFAIFVVFKADTTIRSLGAGGVNSGQRFLFGAFHGGNDGDAGAGLSAGTNGVSIYEHAGGYMPAMAVYNGSAAAQFNITLVEYISKTPYLYINSTLRDQGSTSIKKPIAPYQLGEGSYGQFTGDVAEILMYSGTLSESQKSQINQYLRDKWGI